MGTWEHVKLRELNVYVYVCVFWEISPPAEMLFKYMFKYI